MDAGCFVIEEEVQRALKAGAPVVALESTIISHGMPYPQNVSTALEVEGIVRQNGAIPATIAILDGKIRIGLDRASLELLGRLGHSVTKASRRDIAGILARKGNGATTVAATMVLAHMAGISVFVTGGIGGVHRGAATTMDISADLTELGRTPVAVVCAGAKSILDIGLTLEFLETQGVAVIGYGVDEFPAFFTPNSGHKASLRVDDPNQAAAVVHHSKQLGLQSGLVIGVPIPSQHAAQGEEVEKATQQAVQEAEAKGISGFRLTPFLLDRINTLTKGASLIANIHLVKNNAKIGSQIAVALSSLSRPHIAQLPASSFPASSSGVTSPIVFGGAGMDCVARPDGTVPTTHLLTASDSPGHVAWRCGGVARNVAEVMAACGSAVRLASLVGKDPMGTEIIDYGKSRGINMDMVQVVSGRSSAVWHATLNVEGGLLVSVADMDIFQLLDQDFVNKIVPRIAGAGVVFCECNLAASAIRAFVTAAKQNNCITILDPVSVPKSVNACESDILRQLDVITPNVIELVAMANHVTNTTPPTSEPSESALQDYSRVLLQAGVKHVITTAGPRGLYHATLRSPATSGALTWQHYPALNPPGMAVVNTNGAGDAFCGAFTACVGRMMSRDGLTQALVTRAIEVGLLAARLTVASEDNVPSSLAAVAGMLSSSKL